MSYRLEAQERKNSKWKLVTTFSPFTGRKYSSHRTKAQALLMKKSYEIQNKIAIHKEFHKLRIVKTKSKKRKSKK